MTKTWILPPLIACLSSLCLAQGDPPQPLAATNPKSIPTLVVIGDSTVNNHTKGQLGWGDPLASFFNPAKIKVENRARGGRSSRTFQTEGLWDQIVAKLKPGDFVLIQFGHNDGGSPSQGRARASLKGNGDDTLEVTDAQSGKKELVHTYGWYIRKYCTDAKAKGATPIVLSPIPRNIWKEDKTVARASNDYARWAREAAGQTGGLFIDLNELVARRYETEGPEKVKTEYFGTDHTHTTEAGANVNAEIVVEAIRKLADCSLKDSLKRSGEPDLSDLRFDFGPGKLEPGWIKVVPDSIYDRKLGYGFEPGSKIVGVDRGGPDALRADSCRSQAPFSFSARLPEGNYQVFVTHGDHTEPSRVTVKAESRRLMLEDKRVAAGAYETLEFRVNLRNPNLPGGGGVHLKERELGSLDWDDKLTIEFDGPHAFICGVEIRKVDDAITVYLAGDSTVTDQSRAPWGSWGQVLPRFFKPGKVSIANHAESGESLKSFVGEKRLEKIISLIKKGDYLFIQFAHNDQKQGSSHVDPFTTYKEQLKRYIVEVHEKGAIVVLVTSMHRLSFDRDGKITNSLGDYPEAMRQTAKEENVTLIDLNAMSKELYESLGPEKTKELFMDTTHTNDRGAYRLAKLVALAIRKSGLPLSEFVVADLGSEP